mmetsp:Transcript_7027/g.10675  ORF Transcript_7027/g.10675 Transcript_7027/m.10675 type:complete len:476 (-) Transcript_7027:2183-3610(-)
MPRRPSRRSRLDDDDSESSLSLFCNSAGVENSDASFYSDLDSSDDSSSAEEVIIGDYSAGGASSGEEDGSVAWKEEESSSGEEEEGSSSSFSGEESSDLFSEKDSDVGSVHYLYPHSASYRENDSSSRSSDGSVSSLDGDDDEEKGSSDENSINEAAVGSAKRFYLDEKFRGSVLKEKKREHIPLLRAMAIGLDDGDRQDDRFNECVDNGFVKKADVQPLKRHLYAEAMRRSSGNLKALSSWKVKGLIDHLQNQQNRVEEEDEIWIVKKIDAALKKFEKSPPVWYVSANNKAVGYTVLYNLMMQCEESHIFEKSIKVVWESSKVFHCYSLPLFEQYYKSMKALTNKDRNRWKEEEDDFKKECKAFPPVKEVDRRGNKFWYDSNAKKLLREDVKKGLHIGKAPSQLRSERDEYKAFTKKKFRDQLYAEVQQQRCDAYWKPKRNKEGLERHYQDARDVTNDLLDIEDVLEGVRVMRV